MKINIKNINIKSICAILFISLFLSYNNSGESVDAEKRLTEVLMDVGKSTENAFYSFIELISDTLGFRVTTETTKQQVGDHFKKLGEKLGEASVELEALAKKAEGEGARDGEGSADRSIALAIREAVDAAKITLSTLKGHLDSLKDIGNGEKVGWAASAAAGVAASGGELKKATDALKGIVELAKKSKAITELKTSDIAVSTIGGSNPEHGIRILGTDSPTANDEAKATAIISKVNGEEILSAITSSNDSDTISSNVNGTTSAIAFAKGSTVSNLAQGTATVSSVSGGIALRSLIKGGKLGATSNLQVVSQGAGTMAANKLIGTVEELIKKTIKITLDTIKTVVDRTRK
ncbi:variable large family protein (plasmid) [Borrelia coriaceae]|uniref:Variable large protein n=1 Tax=Borrelia coriaceae ATCC 43381 TaxID=1408429 RepID=W5SW02_9SPIR|nr:variable large family protein [Borrelia coriaceae]AHH11349.1 Variable major outer membrane lipoprotein [Borrelia coriaceae ATCC 43381]UPA17524.1 variable large family protein [Borrelia coriaceae]